MMKILLLLTFLCIIDANLICKRPKNSKCTSSPFPMDKLSGCEGVTGDVVFQHTHEDNIISACCTVSEGVLSSCIDVLPAKHKVAKQLNGVKIESVDGIMSGGHQEIKRGQQIKRQNQRKRITQEAQRVRLKILSFDTLKDKTSSTSDDGELKHVSKWRVVRNLNAKTGQQEKPEEKTIKDEELTYKIVKFEGDAFHSSDQVISKLGEKDSTKVSTWYSTNLCQSLVHVPLNKAKKDVYLYDCTLSLKLIDIPVDGYIPVKDGVVWLKGVPHKYYMDNVKEFCDIAKEVGADGWRNKYDQNEIMTCEFTKDDCIKSSWEFENYGEDLSFKREKEYTGWLGRIRILGKIMSFGPPSDGDEYLCRLN